MMLRQVCQAFILAVVLLLLDGVPAVAAQQVEESEATVTATIGQQGTGAATTPQQQQAQTLEEACCAAIILEGAGGSLGEEGAYILPKQCGDNGVFCPRLGFFPASVSSGFDATADPLIPIYREQAQLRKSPACDASVWLGQCPAGSTMLLASSRRRGCLPAGCFAIEADEDTAPQVEGLADDDDSETTLRLVAAQEAARLEEGSSTKTPYMHGVSLRKAFVKAQKRFMRDLNIAMKTNPSRDADRVRALTELAIVKGFRGGRIDEARTFVAQQDALQRAKAYIRNAPGQWLSEVSRRSQAKKVAGQAKDDLMAAGLKSCRAEAASLAQRVKGQGEEARRAQAVLESVKAELKRALKDRDEARAQAVSTAEAAARQQQQASAETERALSAKNALDAELANARRVINRQHREAYEEAERTAGTTELLHFEIHSLGETVASLRRVNYEMEQSSLSARDMWEAELKAAFSTVEASIASSEAASASRDAAEARSELALARMDAVDERAMALDDTIEDERRACGEEAQRAAAANELVVSGLQRLLQSRDDALSQAASAATAAVVQEQEAVAKARRVGLEQMAREEEHERAQEALNDCRAEAASAERFIIQQQEQAFGDAERCAETSKGLFETVRRFAETVDLLRATNVNIENHFLSSKHAFEGELTAAIADLEAAELRTEELRQRLSAMMEKEKAVDDEKKASGSHDERSNASNSGNSGDLDGPADGETRLPETPHEGRDDLGGGRAEGAA